jgi:hypothetical protein
MRRTYRTKKHFMEELEEMREKLREIEQCRLEFQSVQRRYENLLQGHHGAETRGRTHRAELPHPEGDQFCTQALS